MALTLVTNLSYTIFSKTSLSITLLSFLKSVGTVLSLSISVSYTSAFKLPKSDFAAKLDVSAPVVFF